MTDTARPDAWGYSDMEAELMRLPDEETAVAWSRVEAFRHGASGRPRTSSSRDGCGPSIRAPSPPFHVVHGESDTLLPVAYSRHTAGLIPGAELHVLSGHGHFTILSEFPESRRAWPTRRRPCSGHQIINSAMI